MKTRANLSALDSWRSRSLSSLLLLVSAAAWISSRLEASKDDVVFETTVNGDLSDVYKSSPSSSPSKTITK